MQIWVVCVLWVLGFCFALPVKAQDNPFKIDNGLYKLYLQAFKYRTSERCVGLSDTLYREANRLGDKKAACLAKTIPLSYYMNFGDSLTFVHWVKDVEETSRRNGYLQYYYHAYSNHIIWLLRRGHLFRALQLAEDMHRQAQKDENIYGLYSCIRRQGDIYRMRGDYRGAVECYKEALQFMLKYLPDQDPSAMYRNIAYYYRMHEPDSLQLAYDYAQKSISVSRTYENRMGARIELCVILFQMNRTDEFISLHDSLKVEMDKGGKVQPNNIYMLRTLRAMTEHKWEDAVYWAKRHNSASIVYALLREIYIDKGDYRKALHYDRMYNHYCDSLVRQVQSADIAEMTLQLEEERIKVEAQDLAVKHAALSLENARLGLEEARSQAAVDKAYAENSRLKLKNSNLELEQLNRELELQKTLQREERVRSHIRVVLLVIGLAFLLVLLCLLVLYGYRRRAALVALRKKHGELVVARDKAEQSDRLKTEFIQSVTHEIRTPLNAIVGFSQLLTTPGVSVDEREKKEFNNTIQRNSDLLTTLINDVLDLAGLESGKSVMRLAPCKCNDICRDALASVQFRKASDVRMDFTSEVGDDYELMTDGVRLRQVLVNFLTNAEKYTSEGEILLHCSLSEVPGMITFSVSDTGPGVPADQVDRIFDRFYKVDSFKQGTGLGLSICRAIADCLHGEVRYDLNYHRGARFLFVLPLAQSPSD